MASNINTTNIDTAYPVAGQDNDSQGFRDNFTNINTNFVAAKAEIEALQARDDIGNYTFDTTQVPAIGQDNYVLTYNHSTGLISLEAASAGGINIVDDLTPQLGGDLDVNGQSIVSVSNGNIVLTPDGTGDVILGSFTFDADQTVGVGQDNFVMTYDNGTGKVSLEAVPASNVVDDATPQLGGNLDVQANSITTSTVNGGITLTPNGTGDVTIGNFVFDADQTVGAGQDNYVMTYDNGTGKVSLEAAAGGGGGGGPTILATPESLINFDSTVGSWSTVTSTTLSTNSATAAIIRIQHRLVQNGAATSIAGTFYLDSGTGGGTAGTQTKAMELITRSDDGTSVSNLLVTDSGEFTVPVNGSGQFQWLEDGIGVTAFTSIQLIGYYT